MRRYIFLTICLAFISAFSFAQVIDTPIQNGSMTDPLTAWSGYNGAVSHQAIDSAGDPTQGSGSLLFTFSAAAGSISQSTGLTATGQTLRGFQLDLAQDGTLTHLMIGFYDGTNWDVFAGGAVDVMTLSPAIPADTDGTLDTFSTITIPDFTVPNNNAAILLFIGTSASPNWVGAQNGSKIAIDNVRLGPPAAVPDWVLF